MTCFVVMTKLEKRVNLLAVALPFAGTLAAIVLLWNSVVSATDLAILAVMYVLTGLGVTVGFHRMLTHRSFQAPKPVEYAFAVLGSMAVQGPVMAWVADHRKHHAHADHEGDPHSPHVGHGDGAAGVLRGLWHAHVGWLLSDQGQASARKYAPDLYEDRGMRIINRRFPLLVLLSLAAAGAGRVGADRRLARGRRHRAALGRPGAHLLRAPRDLERELGLPLPGHAPLRDRRPVHQRGLAVAALLRRVLAPQPPRLPALRRPRPAPLGAGARPVGARDQERSRSSGWPATWCASRPSASSSARPQPAPLRAAPRDA